MAIRRCPYCKAIIDEEDKYCNNCGTQLLFPEDETIEEDIPGDRIVEEEEEEEEQETEEDLAGEEAEELTDEVGDEEEEEFLEEAEGQEFGLEEESEEEAAAEEDEKEDEREYGAAGIKASAEESEDEEAEISEAAREAAGWPLDEESAKDGEEDVGEELAEAEAEEEGKGQEQEDSIEEKIEQPPSDRFIKGEPEKKYEISIEKDELVFKTKDINRLTGAVEEGRRPEEEGPAAETKVDLPPWASGMKEIPPPSLQEEEPEGEDASTRREWTTDSGIGLPEKVTQKTLPFSDTSAQRIEEERVEEEAEKPESELRPHTLPSRLKAKLVDVVFITALWLISLWFTAQVIGVSLFRLIFGSLVPVLAFYLILLILYFFLFLYFLGETLGDHYFSEED